MQTKCFPKMFHACLMKDSASSTCHMLACPHFKQCIHKTVWTTLTEHTVRAGALLYSCALGHSLYSPCLWGHFYFLQPHRRWWEADGENSLWVVQWALCQCPSLLTRIEMWRAFFTSFYSTLKCLMNIIFSCLSGFSQRAVSGCWNSRAKHRNKTHVSKRNE